MRRTSVAVAALLLVSGLATAAQAAPALHLRPIQIVHVRNLPAGQVTSTNWSGYAAKGTMFKTVSGRWKEPSVNCSAAPNGIVVFWVGLDGYSNGTVEQDGTIAICTSGVASYYDWWEMYPTNSVQIVNQISAGDMFVSSVQFQGGGSYKLTVTDQTHGGASFTTTQSCANCQRTSAEWIAEAPCCAGNNPYPLPNWGKIKFSKSSATDDAGHTGTISDSAWQNDEITMVNNSNQVKSQPSGLKKNGAVFTVKWVRAQ